MPRIYTGPIVENLDRAVDAVSKQLGKRSRKGLIRLAKAVQHLYDEIHRHNGPQQALGESYSTLCCGVTSFQMFSQDIEDAPAPTGVVAVNFLEICREAVERVPPPFNFELRLHLVNQTALGEAEVVEVLAPLPVAELNFWELTYLRDIVVSLRRRFPESVPLEVWEREVHRCKQADFFLEGRRVAESFDAGRPMWDRLEQVTNGEPSPGF